MSVATASVIASVSALAACGSSGTPAQQANDLVTQGLKAQLAGDLVTAQNDYNQALTLDGNNAFAHFDLGTIYEAQNNKAQAISEYRTALSINANFTSALFNLAVDTAGTDPNGAVQLYRKVIALQPDSAGAWLNLGFVLMDEGKTAEARADWAQATAIDAALASRIPSPSASPATSPTASPAPK